MPRPALLLPDHEANRNLLNRLAAAAQAEYDAWQQDQDGVDEELGAGGICHLIAESMVGVLGEAGLEATTVHSGGFGENHVWAVARTACGVVTIDIPPGVYEIGGGYVWKKRPGVTFAADMVEIDLIDADPHSFPSYVDEGCAEDVRAKDGPEYPNP